MALAESLLLLFVVFQGISFGAGLYEHRVVLPVYFPRSGDAGDVSVDAELMQEMDAGRKFWIFVTTLPLTLLSLANVVLALRDDSVRQHAWLLAAGIAAVERLFTFAYFIPRAVRMQRGEISLADQSRVATQWRSLNYVRLLLALASWLVALKVLAG